MKLQDEMTEGGLENSVDDVANKVFESLDKLLEGDERALALHVGVLSLKMGHMLSMARQQCRVVQVLC